MPAHALTPDAPAPGYFEGYVRIQKETGPRCLIPFLTFLISTFKSWIESSLPVARAGSIVAQVISDMSRSLSRRWLSIFFLCTALSAFAEVKSLGEVSFIPPEGWEYSEPLGEGRALLKFTKDENSCLLTVYKAVPSAGDAASDFKLFWVQVFGKEEALPKLTLAHRPTSGYPGHEGGGLLQGQGGARFGVVYALETGPQAILVSVLASNRAMFDQQFATITRFVDGLRVGTTKPRPEQKMITLVDLVGEWHRGAGSSVNYVNPSSAAYAGNSTVAWGDAYAISADGQYSYQLNAVNNGRGMRDTSRGVMEIADGLIVFHEKPSHKLRSYRFISYEPLADGGTALVIMPAVYPMTDSNARFYGEKWLRPTAKP